MEGIREVAFFVGGVDVETWEMGVVEVRWQTLVVAGDCWRRRLLRVEWWGERCWLEVGSQISPMEV